ncbi:MAG: hypothetical protein DVB22_000436 [Verrucomicrobia bacterium]|jgi:hypothetical protein|nr:MAG: hypothetical protein DVB22_000436 [Verrucomicrobiota bacterium]
MSQSIDAQIASLEKQLSALRLQKLEILQREMAALQASIGGEAPVAAVRRGRKPKAAVVEVEAAVPVAKKTRRPKRGKGSRGPRLQESEVLELLRAAVAAGGSEGISATEAAARSGVFYPRAMKLMPKYFKRHGRGKWTKYTIK